MLKLLSVCRPVCKEKFVHVRTYAVLADSCIYGRIQMKGSSFGISCCMSFFVRSSRSWPNKDFSAARVLPSKLVFHFCLFLHFFWSHGLWNYVFNVMCPLRQCCRQSCCSSLHFLSHGLQNDVTNVNRSNSRQCVFLCIDMRYFTLLCFTQAGRCSHFPPRSFVCVSVKRWMEFKKSSMRLGK